MQYGEIDKIFGLFSSGESNTIIGLMLCKILDCELLESTLNYMQLLLELKKNSSKYTIYYDYTYIAKIVKDLKLSQVVCDIYNSFLKVTHIHTLTIRLSMYYCIEDNPIFPIISKYLKYLESISISKAITVFPEGLQYVPNLKDILISDKMKIPQWVIDRGLNVKIFK